MVVPNTVMSHPSWHETLLNYARIAAFQNRQHLLVPVEAITSEKWESLKLNLQHLHLSATCLISEDDFLKLKTEDQLPDEFFIQLKRPMKPFAKATFIEWVTSNPNRGHLNLVIDGKWAAKSYLKSLPPELCQGLTVDLAISPLEDLAPLAVQFSEIKNLHPDVQSLVNGYDFYQEHYPDQLTKESLTSPDQMTQLWGRLLHASEGNGPQENPSEWLELQRTEPLFEILDAPWFRNQFGDQGKPSFFHQVALKIMAADAQHFSSPAAQLGRTRKAIAPALSPNNSPSKRKTSGGTAFESYFQVITITPKAVVESSVHLFIKPFLLAWAFLFLVAHRSYHSLKLNLWKTKKLIYWINHVTLQFLGRLWIFKYPYYAISWLAGKLWTFLAPPAHFIYHKTRFVLSKLYWAQRYICGKVWMVLAPPLHFSYHKSRYVLSKFYWALKYLTGKTWKLFAPPIYFFVFKTAHVFSRSYWAVRYVIGQLWHFKRPVYVIKHLYLESIGRLWHLKKPIYAIHHYSSEALARTWILKYPFYAAQWLLGMIWRYLATPVHFTLDACYRVGLRIYWVLKFLVGKAWGLIAPPIYITRDAFKRAALRTYWILQFLTGKAWGLIAPPIYITRDAFKRAALRTYWVLRFLTGKAWGLIARPIYVVFFKTGHIISRCYWSVRFLLGQMWHLKRPVYVANHVLLETKGRLWYLKKPAYLLAHYAHEFIAKTWVLKYPYYAILWCFGKIWGLLAPVLYGIRSTLLWPLSQVWRFKYIPYGIQWLYGKTVCRMYGWLLRTRDWATLLLLRLYHWVRFHFWKIKRLYHFLFYCAFPVRKVYYFSRFQYEKRIRGMHRPEAS